MVVLPWVGTYRIQGSFYWPQGTTPTACPLAGAGLRWVSSWAGRQSSLALNAVALLAALLHSRLGVCLLWVLAPDLPLGSRVLTRLAEHCHLLLHRRVYRLPFVMIAVVVECSSCRACTSSWPAQRPRMRGPAPGTEHHPTAVWSSLEAYFEVQDSGVTVGPEAVNCDLVNTPVYAAKPPEAMCEVPKVVSMLEQCLKDLKDLREVVQDTRQTCACLLLSRVQAQARDGIDVSSVPQPIDTVAGECDDFLQALEDSPVVPSDVRDGDYVPRVSGSAFGLLDPVLHTAPSDEQLLVSERYGDFVPRVLGSTPCVGATQVTPSPGYDCATMDHNCMLLTSSLCPSMDVEMAVPIDLVPGSSAVICSGIALPMVQDPLLGPKVKVGVPPSQDLALALLEYKVQGSKVPSNVQHRRAAVLFRFFLRWFGVHFARARARSKKIGRACRPKLWSYAAILYTCFLGWFSCTFCSLGHTTRSVCTVGDARVRLSGSPPTHHQCSGLGVSAHVEPCCPSGPGNPVPEDLSRVHDVQAGQRERREGFHRSLTALRARRKQAPLRRAFDLWCCTRSQGCRSGAANRARDLAGLP